MGKRIIVFSLVFFFFGCSIKSRTINIDQKENNITPILDTTTVLGNISLIMNNGDYCLSVTKEEEIFDTSLSLIFINNDKYLTNEIIFLTQGKDWFILRVLYGMNVHSDIVIYPYLKKRNKVLIIDDIIQVNNFEYYKYILPEKNDTIISLIHFDFNTRLLDTIEFNKLNPDIINYIDGFDTIYYSNNRYHIRVNDITYSSPAPARKN